MADSRARAKLVPEVPTVARARADKGDLFDRLWRLLSSVRFAMLLIAVAALGVLAGTLIMQAPSDVASDPDAFATWLAQPQGKYGAPWANVFAALDLYRVFSSIWFRGVLAVVVLAVVVCTVNRMPGILASVRRPAIRVPERLFEKATLRAEFRFDGVTAEQAQLQAAKVLGARRYRLIPTEENGVMSVFADKNRYGKYGTFLNHIGIISILGAAVLGNVTGWRDNNFTLPEGSVREIGHGTGLSIRNDGFTDEYFPNGTAMDYRSDLAVVQNGKDVAHKTIHVNDPLDFHGVRVHQAFFGPAARMLVHDASGNVAFDDGVALSYEFTGGGVVRNGGFFTLGNRRLAVYVLVPSAQRGPDPEIPAGTVRLEIFQPMQPKPSAIETLPQGDTKEILGYTFQFVREMQFSGLQVVHNPAVNIIWLAAACMIVGMLAVFNFPLRRIWARADADGEGVRLRLAAISNRDVLFTREFETLSLTISKEIEGLVPRSPAPAARQPAPASV